MIHIGQLIEAELRIRREIRWQVTYAAEKKPGQDFVPMINLLLPATLQPTFRTDPELIRQERTISWFAKKLCCDRTNVYSIFKRQSIDTELLLRISEALHYDFFALYSQTFRSGCEK